MARPAGASALHNGIPDEEAEERRRRKTEQRRREAHQMRLFIPPASQPTVRPHLTEAQCIWRNIVVSFLIVLGGIGIYLWIAAHLYGR